MIKETEDTIFALATAPGRSAVAIIRISGLRTRFVLEMMFGVCPSPREMVLRSFRGTKGELIDQGLVVFFAGPNSFTGEDSAEFQLHGSRAVIKAIGGYLGQIPGLRLAEAGEFTRRAFLNQRLDLTQVEALSDLIDSETELQRRQAFSQLRRALSIRVEHWRAEIMLASGLVEALVDFPEEGEINPDVIAPALKICHDLGLQLEEALRRSRGSEQLREGFTIAIAGPPNVGKSTLLNAVARRDVAIVSEYAGTTRDLIEVMIDLNGLPVRFVDMAGWRETNDPVERQGILRSKREVESADIVLLLAECGQKFLEYSGLEGQVILRVASKSDLHAPVYDADFSISAATGRGIEPLLEAIEVIFLEHLPRSDDVFFTRERHRIACETALQALSQAIGFSAGGDMELLAEELRISRRALESIIGRIGVDDILGEIFSRFCVGK